VTLEVLNNANIFVPIVMLNKGFIYKHENVKLEKMIFHFSPPYNNFKISGIHQKVTPILLRQVYYEFNNKTKILTILESPNQIGKKIKITYIVSNQEERKLKLNKIINASR
jgi:hypothetical protein